MMKKTLFVVALLSVYASHAQEKIIFLNEKMKTVKERRAVILEQHLKLNDTLWESNLYYINGPRSLSMQSTDEEGNDLNGRYLTYDRKGFCDSAGIYIHGHREGAWVVMNREGHILRELIYSNDKLIGQKDSAQYHEEAKRLRGRAIAETESGFPGDTTAWQKYIKTHLRYPDRAFNYGVRGTAMITFRVEQDGHIDPMFTYVERSVEYSIDQEALKLIAGSPLWMPAVQDGKPVTSYKKQSIVFKLSRK